ncbi:hypothetical protein BpHYR1_000832 [Brachionus plicatilis]|uniref:Uncharacterized protein n=1 Tax=Brachionus plicatilis TaxID=10195 RepID=A0A3M7PDR8_BRAPC|nr:hypothetical protein BpHYR1_000832 [Brachionus plicatilis]
MDKSKKKNENYRKLLNPEHHCTTISISRVIDLLENQFPDNFGRPFLVIIILDVSNQPKMLPKTLKLEIVSNIDGLNFKSLKRNY